MKNTRGFVLLPIIIVVILAATLSIGAIYGAKNNLWTLPFSEQNTSDIGSGASGEKASEDGTSGKEKSIAERFLDMVGQKIKSIITPGAPIGNLTPIRDLRGTWVSSLKGKGMQTYSQFKTGPGTTQIYQEGDIRLIITSVENNVASGTIQYTNLCTWGRTTAPKIPTINIPKQCNSTGVSPIGIRVSGSRLDFGSVNAGSGTSFSMQGNYTTDLISGSMTGNVPPYGVIKGEFHLIRTQ